LQQPLQQQSLIPPLQKQSPSGGFIELASRFIHWRLAATSERLLAILAAADPIAKIAKNQCALVPIFRSGSDSSRWRRLAKSQLLPKHRQICQMSDI
jgi:hypothetical protein